jgi:hypothetical protein
MKVNRLMKVGSPCTRAQGMGLWCFSLLSDHTCSQRDTQCGVAI